MQGTSIYVAGDTNREQSKGLQKRSKEALAGWLGGWVAGWLTWLEHHPVHQKAAGSILSHGTYLG